MSVDSSDGESWWPGVERECHFGNLTHRCNDVIFRVNQSLGSKDYTTVLQAFTVRWRSQINLNNVAHRLRIICAGLMPQQRLQSISELIHLII